jgi:hypothetical protein
VEAPDQHPVSARALVARATDGLRKVDDDLRQALLAEGSPNFSHRLIQAHDFIQQAVSIVENTVPPRSKL